MSGFILVLFATLLVAFIVTRAYRAIGNWKGSHTSVVSLSRGKGHNQHRQQKGFVNPGMRTGAAKAGHKASKAKDTLRKPWGW